MKPYNKRNKIGIVSIRYNEAGKATDGTFKPEEFVLRAPAVEDLLRFDAKSKEDAMTNAQTVVSKWFLEMENMETADRELNRIESEIVGCELWPNGVPKLCVISFYFVTTENK